MLYELLVFMLKRFQSKFVWHLALSLGCVFLPACATSNIKQSEHPQSPNTSRLASVESPQTLEDDLYTLTKKDKLYAKLSSKFIEKINRVSDLNSRSYYIGGMYELYRMAQHDPKNREILEKLIQHQDQTLDMFENCGDRKEFKKEFDWQTTHNSLFWKRTDNSYLILLICTSGTSNRRFVPFLCSENNNEAKFKPLKLIRFRQENDGTIQRFVSEVGVGRTFPNSDQWFDPVTEELRIWTRLLGGASPCGTKGIYRLQNDEFVLQEFTARFECDPTKKVDYKKLYP